jgi:hypothetical protein
MSCTIVTQGLDLGKPRFQKGHSHAPSGIPVVNHRWLYNKLLHRIADPPGEHTNFLSILVEQRQCAAHTRWLVSTIFITIDRCMCYHACHFNKHHDLAGRHLVLFLRVRMRRVGFIQ